MKSCFKIYLFILTILIWGCAIQPNSVRTTDNDMDEIEFAKLVAQKRSNPKTEIIQVSQCEYTMPVNCKFGCDPGGGSGYSDFKPEKKIIKDFEFFCTNNKNGVHKYKDGKYNCIKNGGSLVFKWAYSKKVTDRYVLKPLNNSLHVFGTVFIHILKETLPNVEKESSEFLDKIDVKPVVKDSSGFYSGEELIYWKKNIKSIDCTTDLNNIN